MTCFPQNRPTRRRMLGMGAAGVAAVALPPSALARGRTSPPTSPDLAMAGTLWLADGRLLYGTVLQSFAVDEHPGDLYALQVMKGGVQLDNEKRAYSHAERTIRGDLCLNRLTMTGRPAGTMHLKGFGHGTSIGVQATRGGTKLWTEWDAHPRSGYGRGICRFSFADGAVLTRTSPRLATFRPVRVSTSNCAALDTEHDGLLLRYRIKGRPRYRVYSLARFSTGDLRPLADFAQPGADLGLPFQGMALYGDYAYQLLGSAYGPGNRTSSGGNTRLYRIDWRSGRVVQQVRDTTAADLYPREPEGLAVMRGGPWLCFGFTHGRVNDKKFSLYRKPIA